MKGAEFHRNNFSGNHVGGGGECCLVRGVSSYVTYYNKEKPWITVGIRNACHKKMTCIKNS